MLASNAYLLCIIIAKAAGAFNAAAPQAGQANGIKRNGVKDMKLGLVDVGGGLRGIYAAGVLDYCMDEHIVFDCCVGVSAGSANTASYLAGQRGRNYKFYCEYAFRKEYMSLSNYLKHHSYIDMDYVYGTLSNAGGEYPLDYRAIRENPAQLFVVAQEAVSGRAVYFTKEDMAQDHYQIFMASSSIPGVNKPYPIAGQLYYDGALGDPVPVQKAFDEGCDRVVLLLTKPAAVPREPGRDPMLAKMIQRRYPASAENLRNRANRYNQEVAAAKEWEKEGKVLIVSPDNTEGVSTLSKEREALDRLYHKGYRDGERIKAWLGLE